MIRPLIHWLLTRDDLTLLIGEIARRDAAAARAMEREVQAGHVDAVLDSPVALDAVRGVGGAPGALPLPLLWYVPVRAALRERGVTDIDLADYAATLPVVFTPARAVQRVARGESGTAVWARFLSSLPRGTVAQAEGAAYVAALALWWAGCFPEWVARRDMGLGMIRAYVAFAARALRLAAHLIQWRADDTASLYVRAAEHAQALHGALLQTRSDYLGRDVHSPASRLERFLRRLSSDPGDQPNEN